MAAYTPIGDRQEDDDQAGADHQLQGRWQMFGNHFQRRLAVKIGIAQVALYGITRKPQVLDQEGVVQPQLLANGFPLFGRDGHAHHFLKRVP